MEIKIKRTISILLAVMFLLTVTVGAASAMFLYIDYAKKTTPTEAVKFSDTSKTNIMTTKLGIMPEDWWKCSDDTPKTTIMTTHWDFGDGTTSTAF